MRRQRGILLLPVALVLAVIGTLAYTMTREGSISVSSVDAEYETEFVRYLAEGGVQLVKWQNEKTSCYSETGVDNLKLMDGITELGTLETGTISREGKDTLNITISATTPLRISGVAPAKYTISERKVKVHNRVDLTTLTLNGSGGNDTTIKRDVTSSLASNNEIELSDGKSHALLRFSLPGDMDRATVLSAQLKLVQSYTESTQTGSLSVHRVTRDWGPGATWISPWTTQGGDHVEAAIAGIDVSPVLKEYIVPLEGLVQAWANKTVDDGQGVLLKSSGLLNARFHSLDAAVTSNKPKLVVRYFPRC